MKILIGCEFSGLVRDAFIELGHDAVSCDIIPSEKPNNKHIQDDILNHLNESWDMMLAFPPCTYLCNSGARWMYEEKGRELKQEKALEFVNILMDADIDKIMIENPIGAISTNIRKPDQIIQPWMFGHGETKATCLWLKNLPLLKPTNIVEGRDNRIHRIWNVKNRSKERSRTYPGIARAMANQWGYIP